MQVTKLLYRVDEVAELLSYSKRTVYNMIEAGDLRVVNRNPGLKGIRITGQSLLDYIESNLVDA